MSFSWTSVSVGDKFTAAHYNEVKTNIDHLTTQLSISAYSFAHFPVVADTTKFDLADTSELRTALDYVYDNNICVAYNADKDTTVDSDQHATYNADKDTTVDNDQHATYNADKDTTVDNDQHATYNADKDTTVDNDQHATYNADKDTTVDNDEHGSYNSATLVSANPGQNTGVK